MQLDKKTIIRRWKPILIEYEKTRERARVTPRAFRFIKNPCEAHHISAKELIR